MASAFHVNFGPDALAPVEVRKIGPRDCFAALREGLDDFVATPTHVAFLGLFYVLGGIALAALSSFGDTLQLVFPFAAGFALVGPFFAVGLYELSRRRERGLPTALHDAFAVFRSPALPSIIALGFYLFIIFALWIGVAQFHLRPALRPQSAGGRAPVPRGRADEQPRLAAHSARRAHWTLLRGARALRQRHLLSADARPRRRPRAGDGRFDTTCPRESGAIALWGLIVAAALVIGSLPLFLGLAVVMPVLGHATWRLYRRAVQRDPAHEVPTADWGGAGLAGIRALRPLWVSLDLFEFLRRKGQA